jgi:hypothetical protein
MIFFATTNKLSQDFGFNTSTVLNVRILSNRGTLSHVEAPGSNCIVFEWVFILVLYILYIYTFWAVLLLDFVTPTCIIPIIQTANQPSWPMRNGCRGCCHDISCALRIYIGSFTKQLGDVASSLVIFSKTKSNNYRSTIVGSCKNNSQIKNQKKTYKLWTQSNE